MLIAVLSQWFVCERASGGGEELFRARPSLDCDRHRPYGGKGKEEEEGKGLALMDGGGRLVLGPSSSWLSSLGTLKYLNPGTAAASFSFHSLPLFTEAVP